MQRQEERSRVEEPGYPRLDLPEEPGRDWLGWIAWVVAFAGLITLIVAVAYVIGA